MQNNWAWNIASPRRQTVTKFQFLFMQIDLLMYHTSPRSMLAFHCIHERTSSSSRLVTALAARLHGVDSVVLVVAARKDGVSSCLEVSYTLYGGRNCVWLQVLSRGCRLCLQSGGFGTAK
mmetsp:Transcript_17077/g.28575  ORF Transcript_17077/g.28575 Transcript_17077/m.28575 type:complete len:120 (+) Transcript_17077:183-542(+)